MKQTIPGLHDRPGMVFLEFHYRSGIESSCRISCNTAA